MKARRSRRLRALVPVSALVLLGLAAYFAWALRWPRDLPVLRFGEGGRALEATIVVPAAAAPIPAGKSALWCASLQLAWNRLKEDAVREPPVLAGAEEVSKILNDAPHSESDLPAGSFYATAGWVKDGIAGRIGKDMAERFPGVPVPGFGTPGAILIAYAYLEAAVKFETPFLENDEPLAFKEGGGGEVQVRSFGLRKEDRAEQETLRKQVRVLFSPSLGEGDVRAFSFPDEFAIDPCRTSQPVQVVLARLPRKGSLEEMIAYAEEKTAGFKGREGEHDLGANDVLLIPSLSFDLRHRFFELERKPFLNRGLESAWIEPALQEIRFRLGRQGVELRSFTLFAVRAFPRNFIFDGPFLIYLKKRSGGRPFFALWVDNAELLARWRD